VDSSSQSSSSLPRMFREPKPQTSADPVYMTLRVLRDNLNPKEITNLLGLTPSGVLHPGDLTDPSATGVPPSKLGGWFFSSKEQVKSPDPGQHLDYILNALGDHQTTIHNLQNMGYKTDVSLRWSPQADTTPPAVSAQHIQRLAKFRLGISFDVEL
jgi:hypothetical protein